MTAKLLTPDEYHQTDPYGGRRFKRLVLGEDFELEVIAGWTDAHVNVSPSTHHRLMIFEGCGPCPKKSRWCIDSESYEPEGFPGVFMIPSNSNAEYGWKSNQGLILKLLFPRESFSEKFGHREELTGEVGILPGFFSYVPELSSVVKRMATEVEIPTLGSDLYMDCLRQQTRLLIYRSFARIDPAKGSSEPIGFAKLPQRTLKIIEDFMKENLTGRIELDVLAEMTRVSRYEFCRLFKRTTGKTATAALNLLRVERAQELIRTEGAIKTLAAIAAESGFADQSHMSRQFKRTLGFSPGHYLKEVVAEGSIPALHV